MSTELEEFFFRILNVRSLDLDMLLAQLLELSDGAASFEDTRQNLWALNSFLRNKDNPLPSGDLLKRLLPVRKLNGEVEVQSTDADFAINDGDNRCFRLSNRIAFFDFDL